MKLPSSVFLGSGLLLVLFLAACEPPRQRDSTEAAAEPSPPPPASRDAPAETATAPETVAAPSEPAAVPAAAEEELPPAEPELSVALTGDRILVSGALRSRIQVERIVADLSREFPGHKIESDLKIEYHRIPVGWGNRVSAVLFVDYLKLVKSPRITFREGVVTLEGVVPNENLHRELTEIAIDAFSGDTTRDLENRMVIEAAEPAGAGKGGGPGKPSPAEHP